jgi:hypothetical protein
MASSPTVQLSRQIQNLLGIQAEPADQGDVRVQGSPFDRDQQLATKTFGRRPLPPRDLIPVAPSRAEVGSVEGAGRVLATLLERPELEEKLSAIAAQLGPDERARFESSLGSFALITDSARTMLDYDRLGTGWEGWSMSGTNYPGHRDAYRKRAYRPDFDIASRPRRERSKEALAEAIGAVIEAKDPASAMESAMVASFISELGISKEASANWKPDAAAIAKALDQELFIPLRALLDATLHLDHRGIPLNGYAPKELDRMCRAVVEEIAQHVVEGDFEEWRFTNAESRVQLSSLTPEQVEAYRAPIELESWSASGKKLTTRDEQGAGLFWVTKIGGPSHGFDMLSQCLLPLLANARNGAIVVEEEGYKDGAARSTLRLFPTADGKPFLYLEMLQVDFPHVTPVSRPELRLAIIRHAAEKARAMGVPLVIAPSKYEQAELFAKELGLPHERKPIDLVLHPSKGVFEASDTLVGAHHAPQTKEEIVRLPAELDGPHQSLVPQKPLIIQP